MTNVCYVFKGAGGYLAWYLGYAQYLQEHTDLSGVTFAGTSAGSIVAAFLAAGVPIHEVWRQWFVRTIDELPPNFRFPNREFAPIAKKHARPLLSPEAFERLKGRLHVSLTTTQLQRTSVCEFGSVEDLIDCVMTSCHVPWVIDGTAFAEYGDARFMDGSVYNTLNKGATPYTPCGEKMDHIQVQTPYRSYEQVAALVRFGNIEFHYRNYIDGYKYAKEQAELKEAMRTYIAAPFSPHFDQSTVSL